MDVMWAGLSSPLGGPEHWQGTQISISRLSSLSFSLPSLPFLPTRLAQQSFPPSLVKPGASGPSLPAEKPRPTLVQSF